MSDRPSKWREPLLVALAAAAFFVATHRSGLPPQVLAPVDNLARFAPFHELQPGAPRAVKNYLLLDPILQFVPWLEHSRRELGQGRLPTWNPAQGLGSVHLGNDQSAVFSLWSVPYYLFGAYGLFLAGLGKAVALVLGVFSFLRRQGVSGRGALIGGLAVAASGPVTAWQLHPHTGAFAYVGFLLLAVEQVVSGRRPFGWALGLAGLTALTLFAGHAQTALMVALMAAVWCGVCARERARRDGAAAAWRALGLALGGAALGVGLAAVHLLPFLEALGRSSEVAARQGGVASAIAPPACLSLLLFPDLLGNPRDGFVAPALRTGPGYLELAPAYAGAAVLLLGLLGLWTRRPWQRSQRTFAAVVAIGLAVVFVGPVGAALGAIPPFHLTRNHRFVFLVVLGLAVVGAVGFDRVVRARERGELSRPLTMWAGVGLFLATVLAVGLGGHARDPWSAGPSGRWGRGLDLATAAPLAATLGALLLLRSRLRGKVVQTALGGIVCLELLLFSFDFAPGGPGPYPRLEPLEQVQGERVLALGNALPPNLATTYGLRAVRGYDALGNADLDLTGLAPFKGPLMGTVTFDERTANLLGIRYLLTHDALMARNLARGLTGWLGGQPVGGPRVSVGAEGVGQDLRPAGRPISAIAFPEVSCRQPTRLTLELHGGGQVLRRVARRLTASTQEVVFRFPLVLPKETGPLRLVVRSDPPGARLLRSGQSGELTHLFARTLRPYARIETGWRSTWLLENPDAKRAWFKDGAGSAALLHESSAAVGFSFTRDGPGELVVSDAFAPGWEARVDGARPVEVRNEGGLRVVAVEGTGRVDFRYRPASVRWGGRLSVLCLLLWLLGGVWGYARGSA